MSGHDNGQVTILQRPIKNDPEAWQAYWEAQGQLWRTEPEIDEDRQRFLAERCAIKPDLKQGIYPFKDIKLSRADVEWLLATHENGRGPVNWSDRSQREREGVDLRGADLRSLDLSGLPLARMNAGGFYWNYATIELHKAALAHFEGASLFSAHLEGALLKYAHLENADLSETHLENANLRSAHLERAWLSNAHLERANLRFAHLEGAYLGNAHLEGANLGSAFFDQATQLNSIDIGCKELGIASLVDVHWSNANLAVVKWSQVNMLGDEYEACQRNGSDGKAKTRTKGLEEYQIAARANRQLAVELQAQGLNEDAARFNYRAQLCQRVVLRLQKKFGQYLFSGFLDLLAGYGYRPGRSVLWYLAMIISFALAYHFLGGLSLYPPDAFVFSILSFHGRGFFPSLSQETNLHNPLVMLAAVEAIVGLLIEISFIATFTQRFFGK
jgi:uncharacterized protein YjbI with pentapeptide repeats